MKLAGFVTGVLAATTAIVAAVFFFLSHYAPGVLGVSIEDAGWMALLVGASTFLAAFSAFFRAAHRIFLSQFYWQVVRSVLLVGAIAVVISFGLRLDVSDAIMATALAAAAAVIALLVHFVAAFRSSTPADVEPNTPTWSWLAFGGASFLLTTLQQTQAQSSVIILGWFSGSENAGLYSAASRLAAFVPFGLSALASITAPLIVSAWAKQDRHTLSRIAFVNARLATIGATVVAVVLIVAGKPISPTSDGSLLTPIRFCSPCYLVDCSPHLRGHPPIYCL